MSQYKSRDGHQPRLTTQNSRSPSGHALTDCNLCHINGNYTNTSPECVSCHLDNYNQTTDPNHNAAGYPTTCNQCHSTNPGWTPATFDHSKFPLTRGMPLPTATCVMLTGIIPILPLNVFPATRTIITRLPIPIIRLPIYPLPVLPAIQPTRAGNQPLLQYMTRTFRYIRDHTGDNGVPVQTAIPIRPTGHPIPASIAMNTIRQVWTISMAKSAAIAGTARPVSSVTPPEGPVIDDCNVI